MRLRGASVRDFKAIQGLVYDSNFKFDPKHLVSLVVVEDDNGEIIAVGSLTTLLECMFVVNKSKTRKNRVKALQLLMLQADLEVKNNQYDSFHAFATNESIEKILKGKFSFIPTKGKVLIRFMK